MKQLLIILLAVCSLVSAKGADAPEKPCGVTAGFGFPVPVFKTIVSLGFEWKRRQAHPNPLIKENYFNITLGINFNEMWFDQRKIN